MLKTVTAPVVFTATFFVCAYLMREFIHDYQYKTAASTSGISRAFVFMDSVDETITYLEKAVDTTDEIIEASMLIKALKTILCAFGATTYPLSLNMYLTLTANVIQTILSVLSVMVLMLLEVTRIVALTYVVIVNVLYYITVPTFIAVSLFILATIVSYNVSNDQTVTMICTGVFIYGIGQYTVPTMLYFALQPVVKIVFTLALTGTMLCAFSRVNLFSYPKTRQYEMDIELD